jgi:hypothetical protein
MQTAILPGVGRQVSQPIYDTVQLAAVAGQTVSFFQVPVGGVLAGAVLKTYAHTNLTRAGSLSKGIVMEITGLSFAIKPTIAAGTAITLVDYRAIYQASHLNLMINNTTLFRIALNLTAPANAENQYFSNIAAAATEFQSNHGLGASSNYYKFDYPLGLEDLMNIQVDLFVGGTVAAVNDVMLVLWGTQEQPIS